MATKPRALAGRLQQATEGIPHHYYLRRNGTAIVFTVCCDCGLTHLEEFKPTKNYIRVRVWRDEERTAVHRNRKRVKLVNK